ncbi:DUF1763-domain-containing protein [Polyplosphaeria fusca]|uniref:DUF1763-domain-containing protein n=1 Tax=Polyplosphaeria fusca TaxID=682080 RepID=A0A9P4R8X1_9PLEO|nr:DUF1763-domain-containing protein [Polyplosphaeria fusca]
MSTEGIVHAYRHLYRHGLRAVHFSKPARYTLRDRLRLAFRRGSPADFSSQRIANTIDFLRHATAESGLEHIILKNLLKVWWYQDKAFRLKPRGKNNSEWTEINVTVYDTLNHNIRMLNESMDICLPAMTSRPLV